MSTTKRIKRPKALSASNILEAKFKTFAFDGEWEQAFNQPESKGVWIVWGNSGSGKSGFAMQLSKYMTKFGRVLYNSLEEGNCKSMQDKLDLYKMGEVNTKFNVVSYDLETLEKHLESSRSPKIIIIDSLQYLELNYKKYKDFKEKYKNKTIIFISHAEGKYPEGRLAKKVMYDAYIKIQVEGYRALSKGREIGPNGGIYTVWQEGAQKYWGEQQTA